MLLPCAGSEVDVYLMALQAQWPDRRISGVDMAGDKMMALELFGEDFCDTLE